MTFSRGTRLKSYFFDDQQFFLVTLRRHGHVFCEQFSPVDESGCNARPKSLRQLERSLLVGDNDLANDRHLKRLMSSYLLYYHEDRTHLGLAKDTPAGRPTAIRLKAESKIHSFPRLGGLHHRYAVAA
jgi:hypothetical protein